MEDSSTGCARVLYKGPSPAFHSTLSLAQLQAGFKTRSPFASSITRQTKPTRGWFKTKGHQKIKLLNKSSYKEHLMSLSLLWSGQYPWVHETTFCQCVPTNSLAQCWKPPAALERRFSFPTFIFFCSRSISFACQAQHGGVCAGPGAPGAQEPKNGGVVIVKPHTPTPSQPLVYL